MRYRKGDEEAEEADARKSKAVAEGSDREAGQLGLAGTQGLME